MDKIEKLIKERLEKDLKFGKANKTAFCLSEQILMDYIEQNLDKEALEIIEGHIAGCGFCLSQLNLVFEAQTVNKTKKLRQVPQELINKAKALLKTNRNTLGKEMMKTKRIGKNLFLAGAIIFFALSFLIPKYFIQFLVATLILGIRWAFESESGRTLIMVLDSWRKHSHDEDDEISRRLKDRFNSFHK